MIKTLEMMTNAQVIFDKIASESVFSANNIGNMGEVYFMLAKNDSLVQQIKSGGLPNTKNELLAASEKYLQPPQPPTEIRILRSLLIASFTSVSPSV